MLERDVYTLLSDLTTGDDYAGQAVHVHRVPARAATFGTLPLSLAEPVRPILEAMGIERLYKHQVDALVAILECRDTLLATGPSSGKSLCYQLPVLHRLRADPDCRSLLLFPTKALSQDQFQQFHRFQVATGVDACVSGVMDGDTPSGLRRRLRDEGRVVFTNPDMLHTGVMPHHPRWAEFFSTLTFVVLDELHTYDGMFGANMAILVRRLLRLCRHYGSSPTIIAASATIGNPTELFTLLTGREAELVDRDDSPAGERTTVLWNPPRIRETRYRSRRSANVEAHELMAALVARGIPTITFSKAKMTAEMIHRYVCDRLRDIAPSCVSRVTPYRGGYRPEERREIERRLFAGELLGVSTTRALELGIDVGGLDACIIVGYPGTRAAFFQQAGRAGRKGHPALVFLVGLDTSVNQYLMTHPEYLFVAPVEHAVVDVWNPFVMLGQLRCMIYELPIGDTEKMSLGSHVDIVLRILAENGKITRVGGRWYHAVDETPHFDVSLRDTVGENVTIEDETTGEVIGEVNRYDAQPIIHPDAIYMHRGDTYRVTSLDLDRNLARVTPVEVDYNTQPLGGTDVHHIDHQLSERVLGHSHVYWGEVTATFTTHAFEKVHFYELDRISVHGLDLPTELLNTMAFWVVPDESILERVRRAGLDAHSGLRGIGYATRMLLPLFMTCDTRDYSHTVGSVNSPWQAVFVYERYPHGLGFTHHAFHRLHEILPAIRDHIRGCPCEEGCPCCVGKPLRHYATWNVERGEASIPSKAAALMILDGVLDAPIEVPVEGETGAPSDLSQGMTNRLEQALRRRLEVMSEPKRHHPIKPQPEIKTTYPAVLKEHELSLPDVAQRAIRRRVRDRELHKRLAKNIDPGGLAPDSGKPAPPRGMKRKGGNLSPRAFETHEQSTEERPTIQLGDRVASLARRRARKHN